MKNSNQKLPNQDWLERIHDGHDKIIEAIYELEKIAKSLGYMMPHVEDDILDYISILEHGIKEMRDANSQRMSEQQEVVQNTIGKMLSDALTKE